MEISREDLQALREAKQLLESQSLAIHLANLIGSPLEKATRLLPAHWAGVVHEAVHRSLLEGLRFAVKTLGPYGGERRGPKFHKLIAGASGAVGGALGLVSLPVELPISTVIMLRSIAEIAESQGESIDSVECQLACLEVFALGGRTSSDDAAETSYYAIRAALASGVSEAARYIAERGFAEGAPAIVRFISTIASRFGIAVSEKVAAQAVPVIGAAGGAIVNTVFIDHFQQVARGHFTIRRLERTYGAEQVQAAYRTL